MNGASAKSLAPPELTPLHLDGVLSSFQVLKITGQEDIPVHQNWRLNERMYGGLTGLNKKETVAKYGAEQVERR